MGSLRDALKKANLISEKDSKKLAHEDRVKRKELGHEGTVEEKRKREADARAKADAERTTQREIAKKVNETRSEKELLAQARDVILQNRIREGLRGNRRFHFATTSQRIIYFEVDQDVGRALESGELAIAEVPLERVETYAVVRGSAVKRIRELAPETVRFFGPDFG